MLHCEQGGRALAGGVSTEEADLLTERAQQRADLASRWMVSKLEPARGDLLWRLY